MLPLISTDGLYRVTELEASSEGHLMTSLDFLVLLGANGLYPSHFLPVEVHLLQRGFVSSHFTRRILIFRCIRKGGKVPIRGLSIIRDTYLHVIQPNFDLGRPSRNADSESFFPIGVEFVFIATTGLVSTTRSLQRHAFSLLTCSSWHSDFTSQHHDIEHPFAPFSCGTVDFGRGCGPN